MSVPSMKLAMNSFGVNMRAKGLMQYWTVVISCLSDTIRVNIRTCHSDSSDLS
ncbi:unnamed protein product [Ixodes pacificus]